MTQQERTPWDGLPPKQYRVPGMPHWLDAGAAANGSRVRFVALWSGWRWVTPEGGVVKPDDASRYDWRYVRAMVEPTND